MEQAKIKRGGKRAGSHIPCMRYVYRKSKLTDSKTLATGQRWLSEQRLFVHKLQKRQVAALKPLVLAKGHVLGTYASLPIHPIPAVYSTVLMILIGMEYILLVPQCSWILIGQKVLINFLYQLTIVKFLGWCDGVMYLTQHHKTCSSTSCCQK